jgi:AsmA protein
VKIDRLIQKKQELTDIVADVTMVEDQITVNKAQLKAFGGTVDASGTQTKLAHPSEPFRVALKIANVELANTVALASEKKILGGKFSGNVDLKGGGQKLADLAKTLAGVIDGSIANGSFYGKDLIATVTGPLSKALPASLAGKVTDGGRTDLGKNLPFGVTLQNGVATLKQPINVSTSAANLSFSGGVRVDGNLDMPGTISLTPQTISSITGSKVTPAQPIPVTLRLTGPAWSPTPEGLDLKPAVTAIVQQAGTALLGRALGVDNVQQKQQQVTQQAQAKADEEAKKAQQQAAAAAEAQKKKIQDQAANKLKGLFGR